jgi:N-formylglutamate amidohydrolase
MTYTTRTIQRAHALGIPVALMHAVDEQDDHSLEYWQDVKRRCEAQGEDFQEILWALFYPFAPLGLHE